MDLNESVKKRFIKDFNLPINITEEPIFSYTIETLDSLLNTKEKLGYLQSMIEKYGEEGFFQESSRITNQVIEAISRKQIYKTLENDRLENFTKNNLQIQSNDIYKMTNVDKYFLSFDIVKANFTALKHYSKDLVLGADSYEDLLKNFTDDAYFIESKQIRQVILGNTLPKKQQIIQKYLISNTISSIVDNTSLNLEDFCNASADEFIIKKDTKEEIEKVYNEISNYLSNNGFQDYRLETFKLNNVGDRKYFVKEYLNGDITFKAIPSFHFLQAYKEYFNLPLDKKDLQFFYEGQLATFEEPIFNTRKKEFQALELN